ncbi:hypothetical protein HQ393_07120 [Chitinibacter bivalviorum]|uniref:Mobilization protein n=1 Tax=Chitinibacter bivalviorum TaxID=2739434 RepID=A0A7H9BHN1_9NEIS|nr:hypothetical protein [Chitinibacter bivalviorum]QLG88049.1 hypothetical protein HQ393_07120 [Chitinibacter bivalviorum]
MTIKEGVLLDEKIIFRVTKEEADQLRLNAKEANMTPSKYIRQKLLGGRISKNESQSILKELYILGRKIDHLINQSVDHAPHMVETFDKLKACFERLSHDSQED